LPLIALFGCRPEHPIWHLLFFLSLSVRPATAARVVEEVDIQATAVCAETTFFTGSDARVTPTIQIRPPGLTDAQWAGLFEKLRRALTIEDAPRGGIRVTFWVKELPIIRDIQFEG